MVFSTLPRPLVILGLLGMAPQVLCLALVAQGGPDRWFALAAGCCYAAIILSFLGGLWWMAALLAGVRAEWVYALAVLPSLIGWAALLPWCVGWNWPGPSLMVLGVTLLASPLVEVALQRQIAWPAGWLRLRWTMASGLGLMTMAMAVV